MCEDRVTSEAFDLRADVVLNAAGPWAAALVRTLGGRAPPVPQLSRAMNLVTRRALGTHACGGSRTADSCSSCPGVT